MVGESSRGRERVVRVLVIITLAVALIFIGFLVWAGRPAQPMAEALAALTADDGVTVTGEPWLVFTPVTPTVETGFIFYPGGLVDPRAYAPAAHAIAAAGYLVVIVPMPLNLAVFAPDRAQAVMAAYPAIQRWAIGGHSLGGAMAASFVADHPETVEALIFWAAYPGNNDSLAEQANLAVTSIYGTQDGLATVAKIEASRALLPPQSTFVAIEGGNHAQFGWYGTQRGDNLATITHVEQQAQVITVTIRALVAMEQQ
jgi:Alpha/beta hydrolase family